VRWDGLRLGVEDVIHPIVRPAGVAGEGVRRLDGGSRERRDGGLDGKLGGDHATASWRRRRGASRTWLKGRGVSPARRVALGASASSISSIRSRCWKRVKAKLVAREKARVAWSKGRSAPPSSAG